MGMGSVKKELYPLAASLPADSNKFSGSTAKAILSYHDGVKELEDCVNSVLKKAEVGLGETTDRAMKVKESCKEAHQWYNPKLYPKLLNFKEG